jgi:hypothetical protein
MLAPQAPADAIGSTLTVAPSEALHALAAQGLRFEELPDGAVVAVLSATGVATDLAERAAAVALALRTHGHVSLSTGRARMRGSMPVGPVIDRAAALLHGAGKDRAAVAIDASTADLRRPAQPAARDRGRVQLRRPRTAGSWPRRARSNSSEWPVMRC